MKNPLILFLLYILFNPGRGQNDSALVRFQVRAMGLDDSEKVYISGDRTQLGNWHPGRVIMLKDSLTHLWSIEFRFARGETLEFKYTKGQWSNEAVGEGGRVPQNSILKVEKDTTLFSEIKFWKDAFPTEIQGQITGTVRYHRQIAGENVRPRDLIVWLPPAYDQNVQARYPVLYMHDGQNLFDPLTSSFGVDWQIDETIDSLIFLNKIDPLIVVGIYNTDLRSREYSPNDTGRAYMNYVVRTVKPLIDSTYRTLPDRNHTATGGSSLGGLISFMLVWEHTDIFSMAACLSSALKIGSFDYVSRVQKDGKRVLPIKIYLDNGGIGLEEQLQPGIDEMISALKIKGYKSDEDFFWFKDSTAAHNESSWAKRFWRPLVLFWGKN